MAEETKNPEVELDTDGVNEETINVEAPEVSNECSLRPECIISCPLLILPKTWDFR